MATKTAGLKNDKIVVESTSEISVADRAMSAAMVGSGIGSLVLGIAIVLSEANAGFKTFVTWNAGVGPLSGKTGLAVIAFILSWVVLHFVFKNNPISLSRAFVVTLVLTVIGILLTFPPVFMSFGG
jgi:hypothetical protein